MPNCACGCGTAIKPAKKNNGLRRKGEFAKYVTGHRSRLPNAAGKGGWHEPWWYERRGK